MDNTATCSLINSLLVEVHRSLLQYSAEASAWASDADENHVDRLLELSKEQEKSVVSMVDFLRSRKYLVDFGVFPHEYTSLHFVSVEYLIARIQESEQTLMSELDNSIAQLAGDSEAVHLIESVLDREKTLLASINELEVASSS